MMMDKVWLNKLMNIKLNEEFIIAENGYCKSSPRRVSDNGLEYKSKVNEQWIACSKREIEGIISGDIRIVFIEED